MGTERSNLDPVCPEDAQALYLKQKATNVRRRPSKPIDIRQITSSGGAQKRN
jgi:hypothetical protein